MAPESESVAVSARDSSMAMLQERLPDQFAPLLKNEWYAIAYSADVNRELKSVTVLGQPLVHFRATTGEPVVMIDRCAHRFYPLSKSHLDGDIIRCGYHGFTYGLDGRCNSVPGSNVKPQFGVRRFATVERGPWLWVWMGDFHKADASKIPLADFPSDWDGTEGYVLNECNYMLVIENLLDLTHLHFLHGPAVADLAYSTTSPKSIEVDSGVGWIKIVQETGAVVFAVFCGDDPARKVRRTDTNRQTVPLSDTVLEMEALDGAPVKPSRVRILHALTPRDLESTHQFWAVRVDAPLVMPRADLRRMIEDNVFSQDVSAVRDQMSAIKNSYSEDLVEHRLASDRFAVKMHKLIRGRKATENDP